MATTLEISGPTHPFTSLGQTAQYAAQVLNQKGKVMVGEPVSWTSSAPVVLEIHPATGLATARGNGTATIRAVSGAASGTLTLTVAQLPEALGKVGGDAQTGIVGEALPEVLRVRVLDSGGTAIAGAAVAFSVTKGGGTVSNATVGTDAAGEASVSWTLGTDATEEQETTALVEARSVVFTADAVAGPPETLSMSSGDGQTGYSAEALPEDLVVRVHDHYGNPAPGVVVVWEATAGGGTLTPRSPLTDESGDARAQWQMGPSGGENRASASVAGVGSVSFSATAMLSATIEGIVTVTGGLLSPSRSAAVPARPAAPRPVVGAASSPPASVPGELLVVFEAGAVDAPAPGAAQFRSVDFSHQVADLMSARLQSSGAADLFEVESISPAGMAARIRLREGAEVKAVADALRGDPRIRAVEPNYLIQRSPIPFGEGDGGFEPLVSSEPGYPLQAWHYEMIRLPEAWEVTTGSRSVTVAVVDDGTRFDHWDLAGNLTADGYDFVEEMDVPHCIIGTVAFSGDGDGPDPDPTTPAFYFYDPVADCVLLELSYGGHGAHVAGTIGAVGGNGGVTGVNWDVQIRPVRVMGTTGAGSTWAIAQGILYAAGLPAAADTLTVQAPYGANVINLSLGAPEGSEVWANAVAAATAAGSLIVAAAGNDGASVPFYPAAYPEVLAVSAVNPWFELSPFSNYGSWIDIAAPGGEGSGAVTVDVYSTMWDFGAGAPFWHFWPGTSMAAPHVSGAAALIFAQEPGISAPEVRQRLLEFARPMGTPTAFGAGLLDAFNSLREGVGFPQDLYVRLVDASTGSQVATVRADPDGSFRFTRVEDGDYLVFAGYDDRGDQEIGVPGRLWGALGGTPDPSVLTVAGGGVYDASFPLGEPTEEENNGDINRADYLPVGGYMNGSLGNITDQDWYLVQIPETDTYTFRTSGWWGACALAAQANTALELYDVDGIRLAENDDLDSDNLDYCAGITTSLTPGIYFIRVVGSTSLPLRDTDQASGVYRVAARRGS